jgi:hypothetical protein
MTININVKATGDPKEVGAQVARSLRRYGRPTPPDVKPRVRPLWERGDLFLEPAWLDGTEPLEDDADDLEGPAIITP